ncbi:MAG: ATP-binding protein [Bacteroidota bacterium]
MNFDDLIEQELQEQTGAATLNTQLRPRAHDLETILNVVRKINTSLVLSDVLDLVVDEAIRITHAERGFLMLANPEGKLEFAVARSAEGETIAPDTFQVSSSVLEDVFTTRESICIESALTDERFERRQSIMNLELQTILCSPVRTQEDSIGVIYVDSKFIQSVDKADVLHLFEILAGQAAIAIKNARLYKDLKDTYDDLKQANEQIIKFERMAMKGEMAAEVSHELKNLVAVVLLNLQVLQRRVDRISPEEIKGIVEKTMTGVRKIQGFSQSLLTRNRATQDPIPGNPNTVITDFIDFIRVLPKFKQTNLVINLADDLPEIPLDQDQIQQVLLNLVNNAAEARSDATITLSTEYNLIEHAILLQVKDNGPGIDEDVRNRLFTEKITTKVDGHGYGLRICKQIIEHHGGTIHVRSRKGDGTTFLMHFPVRTETPKTSN